MSALTMPILRQALMQPSPISGLGSRLHARFAALGGIDLPEPDRTKPARAATFDDGPTPPQPLGLVRLTSA